MGNGSIFIWYTAGSLYLICDVLTDENNCLAAYIIVCVIMDDILHAHLKQMFIMFIMCISIICITGEYGDSLSLFLILFL